MIFGYARVSTKTQARDGNSLDAQQAALTAAGAEKIYTDTFTGTKMKNDIRVFQVPNTTWITFDIDLQKEKADVLPQLRRIRDETTDEDEARMQAYRDSMTGV